MAAGALEAGASRVRATAVLVCAPRRVGVRSSVVVYTHKGLFIERLVARRRGRRSYVPPRDDHPAAAASARDPRGRDARA